MSRNSGASLHQISAPGTIPDSVDYTGVARCEAGGRCDLFLSVQLISKIHMHVASQRLDKINYDLNRLPFAI